MNDNALDLGRFIDKRNNSEKSFMNTFVAWDANETSDNGVCF